LSLRSSTARIAARISPGGVVVVADRSTIDSSSAWPAAVRIADRIRQDPSDKA